jgi:Rrf2 family protein
MPSFRRREAMLSSSVCYAAKALAHIVDDGSGPVPVQKIAKETQIPAPYLAKIINQLARRSLVVTQRGVGGGVTAPPRRSLGSITLHDLCVALDDPVVDTRCLIGESECSDERACPAHEFWSPARERMLDFLRRTTLEEIAKFEARRARRGDDEPDE